MSLLLDKTRNLAILGLPLDNKQTVNALDRCLSSLNLLLVIKAQHLVKHNCSQRKRLGGDQKPLTEVARGVWL